MDVSVKKQFKERKFRNVLYYGIFLFSIFLTVIFGYLNSANAATAPNIITYQGKLLNGGVAVTTTQDISYVLYDDPTAGNALYSAAGTTSSPSTVSTTVTDGFFTIDLGDTGTNSIDPAIFKNNSAVYLKVTIGGEVLSPRKRITASPFAINSKYLDGVSATSTPQSSVYIPVSDASGNFNFNNVSSTRISATSANFLNASSTESFWTSLINATTGWITNLFWTDATSTGNTALNTLTTTGNTTLATTTISSSTVGYLNVVSDINGSGMLSVVGNSYFGTIASGTWQGGIISSAYGGTGTSTFASGGVVFSDGTKLTQNTSNFYWDNVNSRLGLGTSTPAARMHIDGGTLLVNDPINSSIVGTVVDAINMPSPTGLEIVGTTGYVTGNSGGVGYLTTLNLSSPSSPSVIGTVASTDLSGADDIKIAGRYAYINSIDNSKLVVVDIYNPKTPSIVGTLSGISNSSKMAISGKYLFVANSSALNVVDISLPSSPTIISTYSFSFVQPKGMVIKGNYLYASFDSGIKVFDISNPHSLVLKATGIATNYTYGMDVAGQYLYSLSSSGGVQTDIFNVFDISDPTATPFFTVGSLTDANVSAAGKYLRGIKVSGNYAYLSGGGYFVVVDITNKTSPRIIQEISSSHFTYSNDLEISGKYAYVLRSNTDGISVVDIQGADISSASVGNIGTDRLSVWNDASVGNNLLVNNSLSLGSGGLLSSGALTVTVSTTISTNTLFSVSTSSVNLFSIKGNGYIGIGTSTPQEKLHILNGTLLVDNPTPTLLGSYDTTGTVYAVDVSGKFAYVADDSSGLEIFEISNPLNPTLTGYYDTTGAAWDVKISGKYAYVADGTGGLLVFDISEPGRPLLVGSYDTPGSATNVYVSGKYAYVSDVTSLIILDVSNPSNISLASRLTTVSPIKTYISGEFAYMAKTSGGGLSIVNISNPYSPVFVTSTSFVFNSSDVYVSGRYAYLANLSNNNVVVYDISVPATPVQVSTISLTDSKGIYVSGKYAYVNSPTSLNVFDISNNNVLVGSYPLVDASSIKIVGKQAYISDGTAGFKILDINGADISSANIGNIATNNLTVWENVAVGNNLYIHNGLNVGAGGILSNGALAVTVSTTISTTTLFSVNNASTSSLLSIMGDGKVGIGTSTPNAKLHLYDGSLLVDNPRTISMLGSVASTTALSGLMESYVSGNFAYTIASAGTLSVIDISNKLNPSIVGTYSSTSIATAFSIAGSGKYVYVPSSNLSSLNVFDVSVASNPVLVGTVTDVSQLNNPVGITVSGRYVYAPCYTGGGLTIVDVGNPAAPSITGRVTSTIKLNKPTGAYAVGKYVYVVDETSASVYGTLTVVDATNVRSPSIIGSVSSTVLMNPGKVYVSGKYAYVSGSGSNTLTIIDISNPTSPVIVGGATGGSGTASGIYVAGKYAYVGTYYRIVTFDISSSTNPISIGTYINPASIIGAQGYTYAGKNAYVSGYVSSTFAIMDLQGADISSANIGNILTNGLTVWEDTSVGKDLLVGNALNVGAGGIFSNGSLTINVSSTQGTIFSVTTNTISGVPFFKVDSDGTVKINTTTGFGLANSYKLLIDAGDTNSGAIGTNGFIRATSYIAGTTTLDLAETYPINLLCAANGTCPGDGDVVCSDPTVVAGVKKCSADDANHMIGIISTNPGFLLGGGELFDSNQNVGVVKVALAGRVPVKVSAVNGEIVSGDKLTLSNVDGVAAKAVGEVPVVGIAMESFSGNGEGSIIAFVNLGWQNQLYQSLTVNTNSSTLSVGSDITPYNLNLSGEFTMFNSVLNKLVFNATALFETKTNDVHAFIFNATNFGTSTDKYLLSLRSNGDPRFSVMANGDIRASGNLYAASAIFGTSSNPGDLAERVDIASDDIVEPGDVLVVDMNNQDTYRRSSGANQQAVAGVVSTNPTIVVGNGKTEYTSVMAMVGRVPLKVSDENGIINRGDLLVTASSTGYAMKYDPKKDNDNNMIGVVGVALDPFTGGKGKIMALVRTGWVNSRYETISNIKENIQQLAAAQGIVFGVTSTANLNIENSNGQLTYSGGNLNLQGNMLLNVASVSGKNNRWSIDELGHFITKINTSQGEKDMYAMQSPTSEFVFSSSSQLIAGEVKVQFDQIMQELIDSAQPLKINITLTSGEAKGIYVSEKNSQGFTVKELDNGNSAATFDWMVVAKRKEEITNLNVLENLPNNIIVNNTSSPNSDIEVVSSTNSESDLSSSQAPVVPAESSVLSPAVVLSETAAEPVQAPAVESQAPASVEITAPTTESAPAPTPTPAETPVQ